MSQPTEKFSLYTENMKIFFQIYIMNINLYIYYITLYTLSRAPETILFIKKADSSSIFEQTPSDRAVEFKGFEISWLML